MPLVGKVLNYRFGKMVWRTSLAAEYPDGLCDAWASSLNHGVSKEWPALREGENFSRTGRWGNVLVRNSCKRKAHDSEPAVSPSSAREGLSKRDIREQGNAQFPGGFRNPNRAVARYPGLRRVGSRIRSVLEQFLCDFPDVSSVLDQFGKKDAPGFEPAYIKELRSRFASNSPLLCRRGIQS